MTAEARHSLLFLTCKGPWSSSSPAACADVLMTAAVFDQHVALVFCGDGVYQLLKDQDGTTLGQKTLANIFPALELYDVQRLYVEAAALQQRGIHRDDLLIAVEEIAAGELQTLLIQSKAVFVF